MDASHFNVTIYELRSKHRQGEALRSSMSAFFIVAGEQPPLDALPNLEVIPLDRAEDIVAQAARELFAPSEWPACWYLRDSKGCTDTLFTEAQVALLDGAPFAETRLYRVFSRILPTAKKIALWYGDDWSNLPVVSDAQTFLQRLRQDVERPTAESWMMFLRQG